MAGVAQRRRDPARQTGIGALQLFLRAMQGETDTVGRPQASRSTPPRTPAVWAQERLRERAEADGGRVETTRAELLHEFGVRRTGAGTLARIEAALLTEGLVPESGSLAGRRSD